MPSIGDTLREGRMRQRLDIADVERQTKIRAKYLRALENEEFAMLPGPTFVKTFLRTYAELLGLDPHALVEEYRVNYEPRDELETLKPLGPPGPGGRDRMWGGGLPPWAVAVLVVVVILAGLVTIGILTGGDGDGRRASATDTVARTAPKRNARPSKPATPSLVTVRIAPSTPTYVCVDRGPGTDVILEETLDAPRSFRGRRLRFNLGKAAIDLRANGKRVPIAPGPDPVGFEFTPGSRKPLPIGERPCA